jgi:hypothetical protein
MVEWLSLAVGGRLVEVEQSLISIELALSPRTVNLAV